MHCFSCPIHLGQIAVLDNGPNCCSWPIHCCFWPIHCFSCPVHLGQIAVLHNGRNCCSWPIHLGQIAVLHNGPVCQCPSPPLISPFLVRWRSNLVFGSKVAETSQSNGGIGSLPAPCSHMEGLVYAHVNLGCTSSKSLPGRVTVIPEQLSEYFIQGGRRCPLIGTCKGSPFQTFLFHPDLALRANVCQNQSDILSTRLAM